MPAYQRLTQGRGGFSRIRAKVSRLVVFVWDGWHDSSVVAIAKITSVNFALRLNMGLDSICNPKVRKRAKAQAKILCNPLTLKGLAKFNKKFIIAGLSLSAMLY